MRLFNLILALWMAYPVAVLAQTDTPTPPTTEPTANLDPIHLLAADRFIELDFHTDDGQPAGQLEYFMVDLDTGNLDYVVLGSGEGLDIGEELVAVPWAALSLSADGSTLRFDGGQEKLQKAPRIARERLMDITLPNVFSSIVDYYVAPRPVVDSEPMAAPTAPVHHSTQLLVGRKVVSVLSNDSTAPARRIEGARIIDRLGEAIGEIGNVMLDLNHGHVAYVAVQRLNRAPAPLPFEALGWSDADEVFELLVDTRLLGEFPSLTGEQSLDLSSTNLRRLFEHYGIPPYWPTS